MWQGQLGPLGQGNRIITWDMRGHGQSQAGNDQAAYSEAATIDDMLAILDHLGIGRAAIGGLSLGGYMSLGFHRLHPKRVAALMIIDSGPGFRRDEPRHEWNERALATAERYATAAATGSTLAKGLSLAARGMLTQRDGAAMDSLPSITVPTLILVGAKDRNFLQAADLMAAKIEGAEKVVIPEAGHIANVDQPAAFNEAVAGFLTRIRWRG
jgi:pimeloyl-ACP methyl ester carboxylesterase